MKAIRILLFLMLAWATLAVAFVQAQTVVYNFGAGGANDLLSPSYAGIIAQGRDGNMYSTTPKGGELGLGGGIFDISPAGVYHVFWYTDSIFADTPSSGITLGSDGNYYGTTLGSEIGGGNGTIFKLNAAGTSMSVFEFDGTNGSAPYAPPIQGLDGNFYGTTSAGGANNLGTIYKITPSLVFTSLYSFDGVHGATPYFPLVQGPDGSFYGVTTNGGAKDWGTVFKITSQGTLTVLHSFNTEESIDPFGPLLLANDGDFYGTTTYGGTEPYLGSIFKISALGKFTLLHTFGSDAFSEPVGELVQGSDGNFYGTTRNDPNDILGGSLFRMTPAGKVVYLDNFNNSLHPWALMQHTSGVFYGDTDDGGTYGDGVFYEFDFGLRPFVGLQPSMGKPGRSIQILGQGFTHATRVSFDGVPAAKFTIVSDSFMTAVVPSGALTGLVTVVIPSTGNLVSKQLFRVLPTVQSFTPSTGLAGTPVTINGVSLKQTKQVSFGGVVATTFTVTSDSQIVADVPTGARTGKIVVTTAGGSASSATAFTVAP